MQTVTERNAKLVRIATLDRPSPRSIEPETWHRRRPVTKAVPWNNKTLRLVRHHIVHLSKKHIESRRRRHLLDNGTESNHQRHRAHGISHALADAIRLINVLPRTWLWQHIHSPVLFQPSWQLGSHDSQGQVHLYRAQRQTRENPDRASRCTRLHHSPEDLLAFLIKSHRQG